MTVILFAYFGPETMLPFTSIVATVVGIFLMFGRNSIRMVRRAILSRFSGKAAGSPVPKPHFQVDAETRSSSEMTQS
jgi:hypothetical protein